VLSITDHLPAHDEPATNGRWRILCAEDRDGRGFGTHADSCMHALVASADISGVAGHTKEESGNKELIPILRKARPDYGEQAEESREEYGAPASEVVVERIR
jgi:hypothetical protein